MPQHWLRRCGLLLVFAAALVGYGMGRTIDFPGGLNSHGIGTGLTAAGLLAGPLVLIGAVVSTTAWFARKGWRPFYRQSGHCPECDYPVGQDIQRCPECGTDSTEEARLPLGLHDLWATPIVWTARAVGVGILGCLVAQLLALSEEWTTRLMAPRAFALAPAPTQTDPDGPDLGYWTPGPRLSCPTRYGWVDWHRHEGRVFRPRRWTPWPHIGTLLYVEQPTFQQGPAVFYYVD